MVAYHKGEMMLVRSLNRYPVKGLSAEPLISVELKPGNGFPLDRAFAITDGSFVFDPSNPLPQPKTKFLMLAKYAQLARLNTHFFESDRNLVISERDQVRRFNFQTVSGREEAASFLGATVGVTLPGRPEVVHAPGHKFTDVSVHSTALMHSISLINLASVKDLGQRVGISLDPLRFRANIYFDGVDAWTELDWVGRTISIGNAQLKIVRRTKRCAATNVNPATAERDVNIPLALHKNFQHGDLGVYAEVVVGGSIATGAAIELKN